jgi:hypothetical protein
MSPSLLHLHQDNNRRSSKHWALFSEHRRRVTEIALQAGGQSLAILGAGNCNDLELAELAGAFREIHLVDVDQEALRRARSRQPAAVASSLVLHAPVDVSGAFDRLTTFRRKPPTMAELSRLPQVASERARAALGVTCDTVLSACLLSQLMHSCFVELGGAHPSLQAIAGALAGAHLRTLLALTRPGGTAVLVTDTVSSETYPLDELWGEQEPAALLERLELKQNVFSGTGPTFLRRLALEQQVAALLAGPPQLISPWLWRWGETITYLTYAYRFTRR